MCNVLFKLTFGNVDQNWATILLLKYLSWVLWLSNWSTVFKVLNESDLLCWRFTGSSSITLIDALLLESSGMSATSSSLSLSSQWRCDGVAIIINWWKVFFFFFSLLFTGLLMALFFTSHCSFTRLESERSRREWVTKKNELFDASRV